MSIENCYKLVCKVEEVRENIQKNMSLSKRIREIISNKSVINLIYSKKCVKLIESKESDDIIKLSEKLIEDKMKEIENMNKEVIEVLNLLKDLNMKIEDGKKKKKYYSLGS